MRSIRGDSTRPLATQSFSWECAAGKGRQGRSMAAMRDEFTVVLDIAQAADLNGSGILRRNGVHPIGHHRAKPIHLT
jgi:hypothetical protein